jgi:hypothetical protein
MKKNFEILERNIFPLTVAFLTNSEQSTYDEKSVIDFQDEHITFNMLQDVFFDNNYGFFELNSQFFGSEELMILNKTLKNDDQTIMKILNINNFKRTNKVNLMDMLINKFITNKKIQINNVLKISFIKDINKYKSLYDFKIYNQFLNFDDVVSCLYQTNNKDNKTHLRIKIIANYYSVDLNEEINMGFNFLVEIPNKINEEPKQNIKVQKYISEEIKTKENEEQNFKNTDVDQFVNMVYSEYNEDSEGNSEGDSEGDSEGNSEGNNEQDHIFDDNSSGSVDITYC